MSTKSRNYHYSFSEGSVIISLLCSLTLWGCAVQEKIASSPDNQIPSNTQENVISDSDTARVSYFNAYYAETDTPRQFPYPVLPDFHEDGEFYAPYIICSEDIFCIKTEKYFGYADANGKWICKPQYDFAYPFSEGMGCIKKGDYFGFINTDGEEVIPVNYLDAAPFSDGLAYFCTQTGYGFMDHEGKPVFYLDCDSVSSFHGGLAYFSIDGKYGYIDQTGEVVLEPIYDDAGYFENGLAQVRIGGNIGVIDKAGNIIIPIEYQYIILNNTAFLCQKSPDEIDYFMPNGEKITSDQYSKISNEQLKTYQEPISLLPEEFSRNGIDSTDLLCQNHITPRKKTYWEISKGKSVTQQDTEGNIFTEPLYETWEDNNYRKMFKLFSVNDINEPILYCCETPLYIPFFPLSDSTIYSIQNNRLTRLTSGYECGGSARGDRACLWWDHLDKKILIGLHGGVGGFAGFSNYGDIYEVSENLPKIYMSFWCVTQDRNNYNDEYLSENAEHIYSSDDIPFTKENIWEAEVVCEYELNREKVSPETFRQAIERYQEINIL